MGTDLAQRLARLKPYVPHDLYDLGDGHPFTRSLKLQESRERLGESLADIEGKIEADLGEGRLELHYQPRFSLTTHEVMATEALLRWRGTGEDGGLVAPGEFLPIVQQAGFMVALGRWVLLEACLDAVEWEHQRPADAPPIIASINVAGREVLEAGFVDDTRAIVELSELPIEQVQLEIDASDPLFADRSVMTRLQVLRGHGMRLALDGAGLGLGIEEPIAADSVHLHRSWARCIGKGPDVGAPVAELVERAHAAGATVCATGVEDAAQAEAFAAIGCDHVQGFWLCEPAEPEALGWVEEDD